MVTWLPVVDYEGLYEVSDDGQVRSLDRIVVMSNGRRRPLRGRIRRQNPRGESGHLSVSLSAPGRPQVQRYVHHLVLEAFTGPRPAGQWGLHGDDDPLNNRRENLRWGHPAENARDTVRLGANHNRMKVRGDCGHELRAPNLVAWAVERGHRQCLACARARAQAASMRRRSEVPNLTRLRAQQYARITVGTDLT